MAPYYPVFLDLTGRPCVVVGGGEVAERKIQNLLECLATVTVISPDATEGLRERAARGELRWLDREYLAGDLKGAFLAIAATDQLGVNEALAEEAAKQGVILNVVDNASLCTFIAPSIIRKGEVTVAFSTGGVSPALARKLRESLEGSETLEYAHLTGVLAQARKELKRRGVEVHPDRWQECISGRLVDLVKAEKSKEALDLLMSGLLKGAQETLKATS